MEVLVMLAIAIGFTWAGFKILRGEEKKPPIPPARMVNLEGAEAARAKAAEVATRVGHKASTGVVKVLGVGMILVPWILLIATIQSCQGSSWMQHGRALRIRKRVRLAALATGDGWSAPAIAMRLELADAERAALGEHWLLSARMEHASVAAFSQLSLHLAALGAPARLLHATHRAALEEIRHAEQCFAIARTVTGLAHTAGPIGALADGRSAPIDLTRLAIESLVDGCVGEGIAADVAERGAVAATEPVIGATLAMIARDEAGHAELAWEVLSWCVETGNDALRIAVATRVEQLATEATPHLPIQLDSVDERALAGYGVIDQSTLATIARARVAGVQDRARQLLSRSPRALSASTRRAA